MSGHFGSPGSANNQTESTEPFVYTSIRYDKRLVDSEKNTAASCNKPCPFYMLEHHWTRLQIAKWSTFFFADDRPRPNSGGPSMLFQVLMNAVKQWHDSHPGESPVSLRIKFRQYVGGRMSTEIYHPIKTIPMWSLFPATFDLPPEQRKDTEWTIVLDTEPTEPGESTMFKTNDRATYGRARAAADIMTFAVPKEVLLYTHEKHILDGSICTPYFYRRGRWVTPSSVAGGLQGTTRRWALENKLCVEDVVPIDTMVDGEIVWLSNAVRGYFWAVFHSREPPKGESDEKTVPRIHRERFM
ncbi:aminodeoxychorismate lyase-like [Lecanosticta acicola]|uniref:Aminodeoxychorismate lyase-like n=1 Tax=Lecanosticta acicola TaxID=111012 RepID=A0AAI9E9A0_9PEZI|nr:aminodeoxychorismate lyase-like [Lecanosticta acicola]